MNAFDLIGHKMLLVTREAIDQVKAGAGEPSND
jgi:hypothetical protein